MRRVGLRQCLHRRKNLTQRHREHRERREESLQRLRKEGYFSPSQRLRIGGYASMRRSRRNGQLRRVSSLFAGSHSTTRISSWSFAASERTCPKGSATNELPQNCSPGSPLSGLPSNPTRLATAA